MDSFVVESLYFLVKKIARELARKIGLCSFQRAFAISGHWWRGHHYTFMLRDSIIKYDLKNQGRKTPKWIIPTNKLNLGLNL